MKPEIVIVSFLSGPPELALGMLEEIRRLQPQYRHYAVSEDPVEVEAVQWVHPSGLSAALRGKKIGLAPVLLGCPGEKYRRLLYQAIRTAPRKLLAYNRRLERHHLKLSTWIASLLFLRGVPLDRIWLRPRWFGWRGTDRTRYAEDFRSYAGREPSPTRRRVAVLSPYFPYPLSHGGAVRIFYLLREAAEEFDIHLYTFADKDVEPDLPPVLSLCARITVVNNTRYREPRWSTWLPPEVREFTTPLMLRLLEQEPAALIQAEYTQLALYKALALVEHDVTHDLYRQVWQKESTLSAWWDYYRWRRFELAACSRFARVVTMSEKDRKLLPGARTAVIPNGVDLERFRPEPETSGHRILFVGSFRHFPNQVAYRFFRDRIWPHILAAMPDATLLIVGGPDAIQHWRSRFLDPVHGPGIEVREFVADVKPLYGAANLVVVPTLESAGTNLKVLEALAMERAVVSTASGCAGLNLESGVHLWIEDEPRAFAAAVTTLLKDSAHRHRLARAGRLQIERHYDWRSLGKLLRDLWRELLPSPAIRIRSGTATDIPELFRIQTTANEASQWDAESYLSYDLLVAEAEGGVAGFLVSRMVASDECEILNLVVAPAYRRMGIASRLLAGIHSPLVFLEVRESNFAARQLYSRLGFQEAGNRAEYYENPIENAVVMRLSVPGIDATV